MICISEVFKVYSVALVTELLINELLCSLISAKNNDY